MASRVNECVLEENWCEHRAAYVAGNFDGDMIGHGKMVEVPIWPTMGLFITCSVDHPLIDGSPAAPVTFSFTPDMGQPYHEYVGLRNPGEGRNVIRQMIFNWMYLRLDPRERLTGDPKIYTKCNLTTHLPASTIRMRENVDVNYKLQCIWDLCFERACSDCIERTVPNDPSNFF